MSGVAVGDVELDGEVAEFAAGVERAVPLTGFAPTWRYLIVLRCPYESAGAWRCAVALILCAICVKAVWVVRSCARILSEFLWQRLQSFFEQPFESLVCSSPERNFNQVLTVHALEYVLDTTVLLACASECWLDPIDGPAVAKGPLALRPIGSRRHLVW